MQLLNITNNTCAKNIYPKTSKKHIVLQVMQCFKYCGPKG